MDALRSLKAALAHARWLSRADEALALVPDLVAEMPALVPIVVQGSEEPVAPCGFSSRLRGPLSELLSARLKVAQSGDPSEDLALLSPSALADDPLVRSLAELLSEASAFGKRAQSLVLLELVRQSSGMLSGEPALLRRQEVSADFSGGLRHLDSLEPEQRGKLLGALAFSLQARLGASFTHTRGLAKPSRVFQALVASRLALVTRPEDLEFPRDLVLIARILENPASKVSLDATWLAARGALEEGMAQDSAAGATLRVIVGGERSLQGLLVNPQAVGLALSLLPALMGEGGLRKLGLSRSEAGALLGPGIVAATAGMLEVIEALRRLDLLAALCAAILPLERKGGRWSAEGAPIKAPLLEMLAPTSLDETLHGHVVGATQGTLASALSTQAHALPALGALKLVWGGLRERALELGGRSVEVGPPFLAVFAEEPAAIAFEEELREALSNLELQIGAFGAARIQGEPKVARAEGPLAGGWSGDTLILVGPPVEAVMGADSARSLWEDSEVSADEEPTGPIFDPFAPTTVSVQEEPNSPPVDWGSGGLSDLIQDTGELPVIEELSVPPEDLGEAVSYDLLGNAMGLQVEESLMEDFSQDIAPEGFIHGLEHSYSAESLSESTVSIEVEPVEPRSERPQIPGPEEGSEPEMLLLDLDGLELGSFADAAEPSVSDQALEQGRVSESFDFDPTDEDFSSLLELSEPSTEGPSDALSGSGHSEVSLSELFEEEVGEIASHFSEELSEPLFSEVDSEESVADERSEDEMSMEFDDDEISMEIEDDEDSEADEWEDLATNAVELSEPAVAPEFPDLGFDPDEELDLELPDPPSVSESRSQPSISGADLDFLFQGYVLVADGQDHVFGRAYGSTLVDVHRYAESDIDIAYVMFAKDKIEERFSPSSEKTWTISGRNRAEPLSLDKLVVAFEQAQQG